MTSRPRFVPLAAVLAGLLLGGCRSASDLLFEPKATDPLDGYEGSLAQAGISTELDWGPKQSLLLSEFKALKETHVRLEKRLEEVLAENQNLKNQLANEGSSLQQEKALRAQAEAETELLRQRRRELEARILSLSIEKAKLEQLNLLAKIDSLRRSLAPNEPSTAEAAAPPPEPR
jgi:septal ring factor EnvC (AmiA/AmiB activator)